MRGAAAEGGISNPQFLAKLASVMVWAFAIVIAVNQIGIATTLVNTLFMAFVGAIALGAGLAFGLGGRATAGAAQGRAAPFAVSAPRAGAATVHNRRLPRASFNGRT